MATVLCTNGMLTETLAVVRSLGSRGLRVIVADKSVMFPSRFSKYCAKALTYPDPQQYPERFVAWLLATLKRERCDALFIMADDTMDVAMRYRQELEAVCKVPLTPAASHQIAADKGETMKAAEAAGVPCPLTVQPETPDDLMEETVRRQIEALQYPLVIKPRHSSGSRGIRFVHSANELVEIYASVHREYPRPIIQEYIAPGPKYDVCVCYDGDHRLKASFVQRQVRNYPIGRGPSTVHESVVYPELLDYAVKLMDKLPWFGVADIEFLIDRRSGKPKLMEINPRFWSSTHLAIRCGVDFPWILYRLAMGEEVENIEEYIVGKIGRSLLPGDLLHFLSNPERWRMDPPLWAKLPDTIISWRDPLPTVGFVLTAIRYSFDPKTWKALVRR